MRVQPVLTIILVSDGVGLHLKAHDAGQVSLRILQLDG